MKQKKPYTLAVLTDRIGDYYHYDLLCGMEEYAASAGIRILYFVGTCINIRAEISKSRSAVFDYAGFCEADAVIVFAGVVNWLSPEEKQIYIASFAPLPVITLGFKVDGCCAILVDNKNGFEAMIRHILEKHARSKPVFLGGPDLNPDARQRLAVFTGILAEKQLQLEERCIVRDGFFNLNSGVRSMKTLLDERGLRPALDFDTVIAANDAIAAGAMHELIQRGVVIPQEVSFGDYDDVSLAQFFEVSLTTVRQPVKEMGKRALQMLYEKKRFPARVIIPAQLVIRESCGCSLRLYVPAPLREFRPRSVFVPGEA